MIDAHFVVTIPGKYLRGGELLNLDRRTESDCYLACMLNYRCKSVSFCHGNNTCQLNSKIVGDAKTNLESKDRCDYKSTDYSSMKVRFSK